MGDANKVYVLDLRTQEGDPKGSLLEYVAEFNRERPEKLKVRWEVSKKPKGFRSIGNGVAYLQETGIDEIPKISDYKLQRLPENRYRWQEGGLSNIQVIMFILILPEGHTLESPTPAPKGAKVFKSRLAAYWFLTPDAEKIAQVSVRMAKIASSLSSEVERINNLSVTPVVPPFIDVDQEKKEVPQWFPVAGFCCLAAGIVFFMALLILAAVLGLEVPQGSRFVLVALLALIAGSSATFLGGDAVAKGPISLPIITKNPIAFGVTGGVGVFFLVMIFGYLLYAKP